jgi:hypothetical protein
MANHFLASIYRYNAYDVLTPAGQPAYNGVPMSFPNQGVIFYPPQPAVTANGVAMNAVIEVLPTGLNQPSKKFYTDATVATLNTASA